MIEQAPALIFVEMYRIVARRRGAKGAADLITGKMMREDLEHLAEEADRNLKDGKPTPALCPGECGGEVSTGDAKGNDRPKGDYGT